MLNLTLAAFTKEAALRGIDLVNPEQLYAVRCEALRRCPPVPIVPTAGLYLTSSGEESEGRFVAAFRRSWKRIPIKDRRRMVKHWRESAPIDPFIFGRPSPTVAVCWDWPAREESRAVGVWRSGVQALQFWVPVVRIIPDHFLEGLIAHELGHVLWSACGWSNSDEYDPGNPWDDEEVEVREHVAGAWGFDEYALDAWLHESIPTTEAICRAEAERVSALTGVSPA